MNIAVFCSGNGSNFQAIVESVKRGEISAKVALIAIDRSIAAWGQIYKHFPEHTNDILDILVHLDRLRRKTETTFPNARAFVRPGFDEIHTSDI